MAPTIPEEVDVFTVPHSRMKELVNDYFEKVEKTNFCNAGDMQGLLCTLQKTFVEFKQHERIENKLIMKKLKMKLKEKSVRNSAVCNCHKDSHLTDMLRLVTDGYNKKTVQDRINYGLQLKEALQDFTQDFLPHMKQEEEVFQPLLLQYFSYEELCDLKFKVIQQHVQQEQQKRHLQQVLLSETGSEDSQSSESASDSDDEYCLEKKASADAASTTVADLPQEVLSQVFSYLNPRDRCRSAQVSRQWRDTARDPLLWKYIYPVKWAQGNWDYSRDPAAPPDEDEACSGGGDEHFSVIDEDADIDESAAEDDLQQVQQLRREAEILVGLAKYVLPEVGTAVTVLDVSRSRALTSSLLNKLLRQCPNVELLDLSMTRVSDTGLKSLGRDSVGSKLQYLHLSGCVNISDSTLMRLALALSQPVSMVTQPPSCQRRCDVKEGACLCEDLRNMNVSLEKNTAENAANNWTEMDKNGRTKPCDHAKRRKHMVLQTPADEKEYCDKDLCDNGDIKMCCTDSADSCHAGCGSKPPLVAEACIEDCAGHQRKLAAGMTADKRKTPFKTCRNSDTDDIKHRHCEAHSFVRTLKYLDLSGCYQITDHGLSAVSLAGPLLSLRHLDLSGCARVTAEGVCRLVAACPRLDPADLYYCDNITNGPYPDQANGCQNLECAARYCCRQIR